jgi:general secretion pathway protein D
MWLRLAAALPANILALVLVLVLVLVLALPALADARRADPEHPARTEAAAAAAAEDDPLYSCKQGKSPVTITLKPETEVKDLITWVMSFTCKRFVLDPRIVSTGKKVTIVAPTTLTPPEAYRVFLVALSTINLTVVPKGPVYRIVDAGTAKKESVPLVGSGLPDGGDQVQRYVYRPSYAQAETLKQAFGALRSDAGDIQVIGTILLVTDYASHLRDMLSLAKLIDVPGGTDGVYTIPVRHADALKIAPKLEGFLGIAPAGKLMVDERTNTLVLASSEAGYLRVKALVERLDIPLAIEGGATFHVYRLGSAIAEELAATLNQAIQGTAPGQAQGAKAQGAKAASTGPTTAPAVPAAADLGAALEGPVRVIGDKPSNSLIVMSSGRDFLALRSIIRELDLPRRQVYIEALILEVAVGKGSEIGASSHGVIPAGTGIAVGGVQTGSVSSLDPRSLAGASGLLGGLIGAPLANASQFFGTTIPSYGVLFQALADTSSTNVVSAPSIIALDNEEAKYKVGTNIPYQKSTVFTGLTGGESLPGGQQTSYDRRDLLLQLAIKPHISTDDTLMLEVKHEADELQGEGPGGPTWSTRAIETRVVVRDQQTVVIGGLLQEREVAKTTKVPILGDIPLLGHLFKQSTKSKRKTNLVIMLTPYIVRDQLDLQAIRERRLREHEEFTRATRSLSAMQYLPGVDYRRKRGLVEEINRSLQDVEADLAARASLREPPQVAPGVVETPSLKN